MIAGSQASGTFHTRVEHHPHAPTDAMASHHPRTLCAPTAAKGCPDKRVLPMLTSSSPMRRSWAGSDGLCALRGRDAVVDSMVRNLRSNEKSRGKRTCVALL